MGNDNNDYLEFAGIPYYINLNAIEKLLMIDQSFNGEMIETETTQDFDEFMQPIRTTVITKKFPHGKEIDMSKYEMITRMMDIILNEKEELDDSLGMQRGFGNTSISFKIAFNTLIKYGILTEIK